MSRRNRGFTLVELLVATTLMVVVVLYLTQTFTVQHRAYSVIDDLSQAQQNLRAIGALLEREARHAGMMVPEGAAVCVIDNTNAPDLLFISDADAIQPAGQLEPDLGARVASGFNNDGTPDVLTVDSTTIDGLAFYDNDNDGTNDSDFRVNAGAIIVDYDDTLRGRACGFVTGVAATTVTVDFQSQLGGAGAFSELVVVPAHVYQVNAASLLLTRDGDLLAPDVEDVQVALFFDTDGDGIPAGSSAPGAPPEGDGSEYPGSDPGAVYDPSSGAWDEKLLREIRVNFVVRGENEDPNVEYQEGEFQATENRIPPAGSDGFRRRVHRATVQLRNVGTRDLL